MTSQRYEWTAFREADLLKSGDHNLSKGDKFVMPHEPTVVLGSKDDDKRLSGDNIKNDKSNDSSQDAYVDGTAIAHKDIYVEQVWTLYGSDGKKYKLAEIEIEDYDAQGPGEDFFTFVGAVPPAGVTLTMGYCENVKGDGIHYSDLGAGTPKTSNEPPIFVNLPQDGILHVNENTTDVKDVDATDADGDTITYSIVGGRDADFFEIDPATGELSFKSAPDYENPQSGGNNNTYDVTIRADDGKGGKTDKDLWVKVKDVDEGGKPGGGDVCIVIEAEDMHRSRFNVRDSDDASGGEIVRLNNKGDHGKLSTEFEGPEGSYDLTIYAQDESDGQSRIEVQVNGETVKTIYLDRDSDGRGHDDGPFSAFTISDVDLKPGDHLRLRVDGDDCEFVRIDKIKLEMEGEDPEIIHIDENTKPVVDLDLKVVCETPGGDEGVDLCTYKKSDGKPTEITLTYEGISTFASTDQEGKLKITGGSTPDSDTTAYIVVSDKKGNALFAGNVEEGGAFSFGGGKKDGEFDSETFVRIYDEEGGTQLQKINFHTSCSAPLVIGDQYGSIVLNAATLESGRTFVSSTSEIFEEGDLIYTIAGGPDAALFTVDPDTGEVAFINAPDFENPLDVGADNGYDVIVRATAKSDPNCYIERPVHVTVKDVDETASVGGVYFEDNNDNSIQDGGDGVVAGATVVLLQNGQFVADQQTGNDGSYLFEGLAAGDGYQVVFEDAAGDRIFVDADQGGDDTIDSDVVFLNGPNDGTADGATEAFSLAANEDKRDVDGGIEAPAPTPLGSLGGRVFNDLNDNDVDDNENEPGEAGVFVRLLDENGNEVATQTTGVDGSYLFTGLEAGDYRVEFQYGDTEPVKDFVAKDVGGNDEIDSDVEVTGAFSVTPGFLTIVAETDLVSVGVGEDVRDVDAGLAEPDPVDPGDAVIGNRVFLDNDGNGIISTGDGFVDDVTVELLDENGGVLRTTTTDNGGFYRFEGLNAGEYSVRFTAPNGTEFTTQSGALAEAFDDDSNADELTGRTNTFTLDIGEIEDNIDAGLVLTETNDAVIRGRLFHDRNHNNREDGSDTGVGGIEIVLLDENGDPLETTTTNGNGEYEFTGLPAGEYTVEFPTETADGKKLVEANVGSDDRDSDANQTTGRTDPIDLEIGEIVEDVDAGLKKDQDPGTGRIGDLVFFDKDGDGRWDGNGNGENGIKDVTVRLLDDGGNQIAETTTNGGGRYAFKGLDAGTYKVQFVAPSGFDFTVQDATVDWKDSDADQITGETAPIVLQAGETNNKIDAGLIADNGPPTANRDHAEVCVEETVNIDVLANDTDPDNDPLEVAHIDGTPVSVNETVVTNSGATVKLLADGTLEYDGTTATFGTNNKPATELLVTEARTDFFEYSVSDGNGGEDTTRVDVVVKGNVNTVETIDQLLPGEVHFTVQPVSGADFDEAYTIDLDGPAGTALDEILGIDAAYCVDLGLDITLGLKTTANISVATEANAQAIGIPNAENMDLVNWIINQDFTSQDNDDGNNTNFTDMEVQEAIWQLTNGASPVVPLDDFVFITTGGSGFAADNGNGVLDGTEIGTVENVQNIIDSVQANINVAEGFEAKAGDLVGLLLDPTNPVEQKQPFIIAVEFDKLAIDCL